LYIINPNKFVFSLYDTSDAFFDQIKIWVFWIYIKFQEIMLLNLIFKKPRFIIISFLSFFTFEIEISYNKKWQLNHFFFQIFEIFKIRIFLLFVK
jgi:hypothetical protein